MLEETIKEKDELIEKNQQDMQKKDTNLREKDDTIRAMEKAKNEAEAELKKIKEDNTKQGMKYTSVTSIHRRYSNELNFSFSGNDITSSGRQTMTFGDVMTSVCFIHSFLSHIHCFHFFFHLLPRFCLFS